MSTHIADDDLGGCCGCIVVFGLLFVSWLIGFVMGAWLF